MATALILASPCRDALAQGIAAPARGAGTGRPAEGVVVHGRWTIDVRNPDGTLVSHTEFDNALQPTGNHALAKILAGVDAPSGWLITLSGPGGFPPLGAATPSTVVAGDLAVALRLSADLRNDGFTPPIGPPAPPVTAITAVASTLTSCPVQAGPAGPCNQHVFSFHALASAIPVAPHQIIQVTVDISFHPMPD